MFVGSFIGAGVTLDPPPSFSSQEVLVEESTEPIAEEARDLIKPLAETSVTTEETTTVEESTPEIESYSSYVESKPVVDEPVYVSPVVEAEPEPEAPSYICSYNAYNCGDFSSWYEANQVYNYCLSIGAGDIHDLDRDNDGACDTLNELY